MKIELTGTPNLGDRKERTENFEVIQDGPCIKIKDEKGKTIVSFNPFFDGGSLWIKDFSSLIMDVEEWGEDKAGKFTCLNTENINASSGTVKIWKEDSEKLAKIREARQLLMEGY